MIFTLDFRLFFILLQINLTKQHTKANNDHPSVLPFEMYNIESGEPPSRSLSWKPLVFLSHIKKRTNSDRFPLSLWEVWFCSTIGVPIPALI